MTTWSDEPQSWPVTKRETKVDARVFQLVTDHIQAPDGEVLIRSYLRHPGAVGVVAVDEQDRVVVVHQYRHPVGEKLVELPAGLLDVDGEDYLAAAQRELAEEALLAADDWQVLVDVFASPGSTQESIRLFLAQGLREAPRPDGFVVEGEELDMEIARIPLETLVSQVFAGECGNALLAMGVLALQSARAGQRPLRPADAPWPAREIKRAHDAVASQ